MYVVKRSGQRESVSFDKILARIVRLSGGLDVDPARVAQKVIGHVHSGVSTEELDRLVAETAAYMGPDYSILASRVLVSNLHKQTKEKYSDVVGQLSYVTTHGRCVQLLSDEFISAATTHAHAIQAALDYTRDFDFDYFGLKTLERSYLLRVNGRVVERPQHMYMRIALGIQLSKLSAVDIDVPELVRTYNMLSAHIYFLLPVDDDSIVGTLKKCAVISKNAGDIGVGTSNAMLKVLNDTARYVYCSVNLTSDAAYKKILKHDNVVELLCEIFLYGASQAMHVTTKHPLMVVQCSPNPIASLKMGTRCTEYLDAPEIQKGDFMVFVVPNGQRADVANDAISFLGACALSHLNSGVAHFRIREPHAALEVSTMANSLGLQVDYQMDTKINTLSVRVHLSKELQGLTLSSMDESQHFAYLTGMLRVCDVTPMPVVLIVNGLSNDMVRQCQYHAMHSGHVSFVSNDAGLSTVRIIWSKTLQTWWRGFNYNNKNDFCEMIITDRVHRWEDKLLVPILDIIYVPDNAAVTEGAQELVPGICTN